MTLEETRFNYIEDTKDTFICPETEKRTSKETCKSTCYGEGCKLINSCKYFKNE